MTLVLVGIFVGLSALVQSGAALDVARLAGDAEASPTLALLGFLASMNLMLFVFNLIPAFPLDGGRIARAVVWRITGDRNRATRVAGRIGEGFAYLLIGVGIFLAARGDLFNGLWLAVIGWFIAQSARAAVASTAFTERIDGITVADIMDAQPVSMPAGTPLTQAAGRVLPALPLGLVSGRRRARPLPRRRARAARRRRRSRPAGRRSRSREIVETGEAAAWRVRSDSPLEALLGDEQLRSRGALMAVDADGVLRGVVTLDQVRRALTAALPQRLA